jgi:hypothetical protein
MESYIQTENYKNVKSLSTEPELRMKKRDQAVLGALIS